MKFSTRENTSSLFSFITKHLKLVFVLCLLLPMLFSMVEGRPNRKYRPKSKPLRVFIPNFHGEVTRSFALCCSKLNYQLIVPGHTCYPKDIDLGVRIDKEYIKNIQFDLAHDIEIAEGKALFKNPPDIVIAFGPHHVIYEHIWKKLVRYTKKDIKFVVFTGNNGGLCGVPRHMVKNAIVTDLGSYTYGTEVNVPHLLYWSPVIDFENSLRFRPCTEMYTLGTYINTYQEHFPIAHELYKTTIENYSSIYPGCTFNQLEGCFRQDVINAMAQSSATVHIKTLEGFGYSIIESMAIGRPVFLYEPYSHGMRYRDWSIEGVTAFYFSTQEEFNQKLQDFLKDPEHTREVQFNCAQKIREIFDNKSNLKKLKAFFNTLHSQVR